MIFWNVAGLGRQDRDFWEFVKEYDYIGLSETWVEEKGWNNIKDMLPGSHTWECCFAERSKERQS